MSDERAETAARLLRGLGPVQVSVRQILDPRAFKHAPHPLSRHAALLAEAFGAPVPEGFQDEVWRFLVASELLPQLPAPVTLSEMAHNPAFAAFVDGLSENDGALPDLQVSVPEERVASLCLDALAGLLTEPPASAPPRPSVLTHGTFALVGRRVTAVFHDGDELSGRLTSLSDDVLTLAADGRLVMVPFTSLSYVDTFQLTEDEVSASDQDV